jgi:hypothetical protein
MQDDKSFVQVPIRVLMDNTLTSGQKILFASLMSFDFADKKGKRKGMVYPGIHTLRERSGLSERSVISGLNRLVELNYITRIRVGKKCNNRYVFVHPPTISEPQDLQFTDAGFAEVGAEMS